MSIAESVVTFECEGEQLVGILSVPDAPTKSAVVIVVGGPQYRVGSHRQFALLARELAQNGITTLRFDYRGMGDSSGAFRDFTDINSDLRAAVDALQKSNPEITQIFLWGLCDAASASLFYAPSDPRIAGLVIANPWVRTEAGEAKAYLSHYYGTRFFDAALWRKILRGQFDFRGSIKSFWQITRRATTERQASGNNCAVTLPERMYDSWAGFSGDVLLFISGEDLTAKEFSDMVAASPRWRSLVGKTSVTTHSLPEANHTFSRAVWRNEVAAVTASWINQRANNGIRST